jgi:dTDP-4-dehydrorhamnose reductase
MKWLITGLNGTLAPKLAQVAAASGVDVVGWDRQRVAPDDLQAAQQWLHQVRPDAIAHLGMGSADWAGRLAAHAAQHALPFVFTSSAMVFHHLPDGPHAVGDARTAQDDYGRYKMACEDAVLAAYPQASVARIGWQIDPIQPGNNMLQSLDQWQATQSRVSASRAWKPACSFMDDTAAALAGLLRQPVPGVWHLDSNAEEGHSFASLVQALKLTFGRDAWQVQVHDDYVHDQRLAGGQVRVPALSTRLTSLAPTGRGCAVA